MDGVEIQNTKHVGENSCNLQSGYSIRWREKTVDIKVDWRMPKTQLFPPLCFPQSVDITFITALSVFGDGGLRRCQDDTIHLDRNPPSSSSTTPPTKFSIEKSAETKFQRLISEYPVIILSRSSCCIIFVLEAISYLHDPDDLRVQIDEDHHGSLQSDFHRSPDDRASRVSEMDRQTLRHDQSPDFQGDDEDNKRSLMYFTQALDLINFIFSRLLTALFSLYGFEFEILTSYLSTAKGLYSKYGPKAEQCAVLAWRKLNQLPLFPQVAQVFVPTAAFCSEKYNQTVLTTAEKGYRVSSYLPLVRTKRIAKLFSNVIAESQPLVSAGYETDVSVQ
ncbi:hypothetical protein Patl1_22512 [Pistacia atlantica]|uniref:Uncharacterized protein n=1 Tax=Pistacia atlantica TaxID=434234 RepID=A0ACC0ZXQ1_9ROSI|nr:hypothetical protein Patl1_22512 [Pistacia atlantica]